MPVLRFLTLLCLFLLVYGLGPAQAQQNAPAVIPQPPQADGSLVHEVRPGDTLNALLIAYAPLGVTLEQMLELNGWQFPPQFIFVGQRLILLPPGSLVPTALPPSPAPTLEGVNLAPPAGEPVQTGAFPVVLNQGQVQALALAESFGPFIPSTYVPAAVDFSRPLPQNVAAAPNTPPPPLSTEEVVAPISTEEAEEITATPSPTIPAPIATEDLTTGEEVAAAPSPTIPAPVATEDLTTGEEVAAAPSPTIPAPVATEELTAAEEATTTPSPTHTETVIIFETPTPAAAPSDFDPRTRLEGLYQAAQGEATSGLEVAAQPSPTLAEMTATPLPPAEAAADSSGASEAQQRLEGLYQAAQGETASGVEVAAQNTAIPAENPPATSAPATEVAAIPAAPIPGLGASLCLSFYEDGNQNGRQDPSEVLLAGGNFRLGEGGTVLEASAAAAICAEDLAESSLIILAQAPDGYGLTSPARLQVNLSLGRPQSLAFGVSPNYTPPSVASPIAETLSPPGPASVAASAADSEEEGGLLGTLWGLSAFFLLGLAALSLVAGLGLVILRRYVM